jgi:hypothetical protein
MSAQSLCLACALASYLHYPIACTGERPDPVPGELVFPHINYAVLTLIFSVILRYANISAMPLDPANTTVTQGYSSGHAMNDRDGGHADASANAANLKRLACNPCRERKVRCDRRQPKCGRCAKIDGSCHYSSPSKHALSKSELSRILIALHGRLGGYYSQRSLSLVDAMKMAPFVVRTSGAWTGPFTDTAGCRAC